MVAPNSYASCCVSLAGLDRHVLIVPREKKLGTDKAVVFGELYEEIKDVMSRVIPHGKGRFLVKKVRRKYAFEVPDVPRDEAEYLELVYSYKFPPLPQDCSGKTFSRCVAWRDGGRVGAVVPSGEVQSDDRRCSLTFLVSGSLVRVHRRWRRCCCTETSWARAGLS